MALSAVDIFGKCLHVIALFSCLASCSFLLMKLDERKEWFKSPENLAHPKCGKFMELGSIFNVVALSYFALVCVRDAIDLLVIMGLLEPRLSLREKGDRLTGLFLSTVVVPMACSTFVLYYFVGSIVGSENGDGTYLPYKRLVGNMVHGLTVVLCLAEFMTMRHCYGKLWQDIAMSAGFPWVYSLWSFACYALGDAWPTGLQHSLGTLGNGALAWVLSVLSIFWYLGGRLLVEKLRKKRRTQGHPGEGEMEMQNSSSTSIREALNSGHRESYSMLQT